MTASTAPRPATPPAAGFRLAAAARLGPVVRFVRAAPFCVALTGLLWLVGAVTGSVVTGPGRSLRAVIGAGSGPLARGHWWAPATSALWSSGLGGYVAVSVLLLAVCAPVERRIGTGRAALLFTGCQIAGTAAAVGLVVTAARSGDAWAADLSRTVSVGASPGAIGMLLGGTAVFDPLWRRRLRVLVVAALITTMLYAGDLPDVVRLAAGLAGLAAGALLPTPHPGTAPPGPAGAAAPTERPDRDRRALVAMLVAASAIGPLSTILAAHRDGPLSALNFLFLPSLDAGDVAGWCTGVSAAAGRHQCIRASTAFLVQGIGPLFQTLLPVLVLLVLAEGLRRGRRAAYLGTVIANVGLALIGAVLSGRAAADLISDSRGRAVTSSEFWMMRLAPIILPLAIAALVFACRREFGVRMPWRVHRPWVVVTATTAVITAAGYLTIGWAVRHQFRPAPSPHQLLASLPGRFAPAGYLGAVHDHFFPVGPVAVGLYEWAGAVFWAVTLIMTAAGFWRSRRTDTRPDRDAAARILRRHGGPSSLAYMTLWPGNHYWFTPDGCTAIAYRVIAAVAVTTGDPIGPRPAQALAGFTAHCAAAGWTPCFFSVTPATAQLLHHHGFRSLQVASDTIIDMTSLSFSGKRWQDIRTALNRAHRDGVHALWSRYHELPRTLTDQLTHIDAQWLAGKQLPEMGFTLGGLAELDDPDVRCLLAVNTDQQVLAVTSWLPGYHDGHITGWTLDYMRRGPDAFPGAMEFLIATALTTFRDEGATWASLSGVPLAWPDGDRPDGPLGRTMDAVAGMLEPVYGFRSLLAFKAKFAPEYRPLLMAYPNPTALPAVTNAVLRAYVPHLRPTQFAHLVHRIIRPGSTSDHHPPAEPLTHRRMAGAHSVR